jgi:phosphopantetheine adenylyltransferase
MCERTIENLQRRYYTERLNEEEKLMQIREKLDELGKICKYNFWDFQMVLRIKEALGFATKEEEMQIIRIRGEEATETPFQILERFKKTKELELEVANKRDLRIAKQEIEREISILQEIKQILKDLPSKG